MIDTNNFVVSRRNLKGSIKFQRKAGVTSLVPFGTLLPSTTTSSAISGITGNMTTTNSPTSTNSTTARDFQSCVWGDFTNWEMGQKRPYRTVCGMSMHVDIISFGLSSSFNFRSSFAKRILSSFFFVVKRRWRDSEQVIFNILRT